MSRMNEKSKHIHVKSTEQTESTTMKETCLCVLSGDGVEDLATVSEPPGSVEHQQLLLPAKRTPSFQ